MSKPSNSAPSPRPRAVYRRSARTVLTHLRRVQQQLDGLIVHLQSLRRSLVLPGPEERRKQLDEEVPITLEVHLAGVLKILGLVVEDAEAIAADGLRWTPAKLRKAWHEAQQNRPFSADDRKLIRKPILEHRNPGEPPAP